MNHETRVISRQLEVRADGDKVFAEGYAAVFYNPSDMAGTQYNLWGDYFERIMPGAFDEALKRADDVRCLFNHNVDLVLGRTKSGTCTLRVDAVGLWFSCQLPDDECGRSTAQKIRRGDVSGCSFSFLADSTVWREEGELTYREIMSVRLYDVGPVTFPAYSGTDVTLAKRSYETHRRAHPPRDLASIERSRRLRQVIAQ